MTVFPEISLYWSSAAISTALLLLNWASGALAQSVVIPDDTLGIESSAVEDIDALTQYIEGGAQRGGNLFHSFLEFNVADGHSVYFNPDAEINSILTRVTGSNASNIFGRLGVIGATDLFLMNPNGIVFGENASLDISGSFYGTTAEAIPLGDAVFSAIEPETSSLLTVSPGTSFLNYLTENSGNIANEAQLIAQEDLTLAASNLQLQGQIGAGHNLSLLATDTVTIRDTALAPFVASSGNELTVQGNQGVDIFALNHPQSGLYTGGNMVLRSDMPIIGDAHFYTNGNFNTEQLNKDPQTVLSPTDPIILAGGNVELGDYSGASLHILAGGSVTLANVTINNQEAAANGVDLDATTIHPQNFTSVNGQITFADLAEFTVPDYKVTVNENGIVDHTLIQRRILIDGNSNSTLDIRAGVDWEDLGGLRTDFFIAGELNFEASNIEEMNMGANIITRNIRINDPNGQVFLTNQFQPKISSLENFIDVESIDTSNFGPGNGGQISIYSRGDINVDGELNSNTNRFAGPAGSGGDITLSSQFGRITTAGTISSRAITNEAVTGIDNTGQGGDIILTTETGNILVKQPLISSTTSGQSGDPGFGGNIVLASGSGDIAANAFISSVSTSAGGNSNSAGNIIISSQSGNINLRGDLESYSLSRIESSRNGGMVSIYSPFGNIQGNGVRLLTFSISEVGDTSGNAGAVILEAQREITGFEILTLSSSGNSGTVQIRGNGDLLIQGLDLITSAQVEILDPRARDRTITLDTSDFGQAGTTRITGLGSLTLDEVQILSDSNGSNSAGGVTLSSIAPIQFLNSQINTNANSLGVGGDILIHSPELVFGDISSFVSVETSENSRGDAGNITLQPVQGGELVIRSLFNGSPISASTLGDGNGGNIRLINADSITLDNVGLTTSTSGNGLAGNIIVEDVDLLVLRNGSFLLAEAGTVSDGGNILIDSDFVVAIPGENSDIIANAITGDGGNINISGQILGLEALSGPTEVLRANRTNDISARSETGRPGTITVTQIDVDPSEDANALSESFINPDDLIADSCLARDNNRVEGTFTVTGLSGLPQQPGDLGYSDFSTGDVETIPTESSDEVDTDGWQLGDEIVEPDRVLQTQEGRLILSSGCPR